MITSRGRTRVALLRLALYYSVVPLRSAHKPIPYEDRKESRGVVSSRERTTVALLRLALCYSVVPLRSAHKPIPYEDSKCMCQRNQVKSKPHSHITLLLFTCSLHTSQTETRPGPKSSKARVQKLLAVCLEPSMLKA